jgi:hypothetical protein
MMISFQEKRWVLSPLSKLISSIKANSPPLSLDFTKSICYNISVFVYMGELIIGNIWVKYLFPSKRLLSKCIKVQKDRELVILLGHIKASPIFFFRGKGV